MTSALPLASSELRAEFLHWLERFAAMVRDVDYAAARPLFHPEVVAFGTHRDMLPDRETWIAQQWDNVWPRTSDFAFDLPTTTVLASPDARMVVLVTPWDSIGYAPDGSRFDRPGRATMVFLRADTGWTCVHSHMSLNRGVPQTSHAERPVKAR